MHTLEAQKDILDEKTLDLLMTYNPRRRLAHCMMRICGPTT